MATMARYNNNNSSSGFISNNFTNHADVAWKMGRILLKYRPIAPKPVTGGNVTAPPLETGNKKRKGCGTETKRGRKRTKKALVVDTANTFCWDSCSPTSSLEVVTLPLMPVTPERKEDAPSPTSSDGRVAPFGCTTWQKVGSVSGTDGAALVAPRPVRPVGSWVTVECITDTWHGWEVPLSTHAVLEHDTCPGFVSDACDRVMWMNSAYRNMVVGPSEEEEEEDEVVKVALVTRGMVPENATCFTCRARVQYVCRSRGRVLMAVPCDVWRLCDGRLAWRLDVKAALSLGMGELL